MWRKSESTVKPSVLEKTDEGFVYIRKNITEEVRTDQMSGKEITYYVYDEDKLSNADYQTYTDILANASDITTLQLAVVEIIEMMGE